MKKYLVEFIGTFFLVFTIGNTVLAPGAQESGRPEGRPPGFRVNCQPRTAPQAAALFWSLTAAIVRTSFA